jgi:hypothetical protein
MTKLIEHAFFAVSLVCGVAMLGLGLVAADVNASLTSLADKQTFDAVVSPFLEKYCVSCHGDKKVKGNTRLHQINFDLASSQDLDKWQTVYEQLQIGEMPPEDEPQPDNQVKQRVLQWIDQELAKSGNPNTFHEMQQKPHYGNLVSHDKLFSGEIKEESFSPARLWRRSPYHFDQSKVTFLGDDPKKKPNEELNKILQPFQKGDGEGITDYAALLYADSATLDSLYRNAETTVDLILLMAFIEMDYKAQGKTMADWKADRAKVLQAQQDEIEKLKKTGETTRYIHRLHVQMNEKYRIVTPQILKDIVLSETKPTKAMMEAAVKLHFNRVLQRDPTESDLEKYTNFMADGIETSGPYFGLRNALIAIMVSPQFIYRSELGLGKALGDGRTMLSPVELAYAISYALTDDGPDAKLVEAVKNGQLTTKEDVKREVARLLNDDRIEKPRIMRFFHEFFGYDRAPQVFKDDARFFKGYTFFKVASLYVSDADALVRHIVKNDKDVLKELLTTDRFFVLHDGDNESRRIEVEANKKLFAYFKDKNWKNYATDAKKLEEPSAVDIKFAMSLHPEFRSPNGSLKNGEAIFNKMRQLEPFEKKGIIPATYDSRRSTQSVFDGLAAYNLPGKNWNFQVEQPFVLAKGKRAGILSHPSWLIAHSLNATTDPVRRGKWIRNFLLAENVPDVPITVDATVPEDHHKTLRERYAMVTEKPECIRCHTLMNPLGYAFEIFDDFGRWRSEEIMEGLPVVEKKPQTKPINSKGYLSGSGDSKLDGEVVDAIDLVHRLAQSRRVQQSFIRHVFRYYMGRNEMLTDSKTLIQAEKDYVSNGGSFKALIISLLTSDSFLYRKKI